MWSLSLVTEVTGASVGPHNETEILILDDDGKMSVTLLRNAWHCMTLHGIA